MKNQTLCLCLAALALAISACNKPDPETTTPTFSISETSLSAAIEGGTYSFGYTVTDPAKDGAVTCFANVDWITDFNLSVSSTVSFTVEANTGSSSRTGTIAAVYSYSGKDIEKDIIVSQAYDKTVRVEAVMSLGLYFGDTYDSGMYEYYIALSDQTISIYPFDIPYGTKLYIIDFWTAEHPEDEDDIKLPEGTYIAGDEEEEHVFANTMGLTIYDYEDYDIDETYFDDGTVVVSYEGDVCTITANLIDEDNITHIVTYSGTITFLNLAGYMSTGTEDTRSMTGENWLNNLRLMK